MKLVKQLAPAGVDTDEELLSGSQQKDLMLAILVTSRTDAGVRFTMRLKKQGEAEADKQILIYREQVSGGATWTLPTPISVEPGDKLLFQASDTSCTVTVFSL